MLGLKKEVSEPRAHSCLSLLYCRKMRFLIKFKVCMCRTAKSAVVGRKYLAREKIE